MLGTKGLKNVGKRKYFCLLVIRDHDSISLNKYLFYCFTVCMKVIKISGSQMFKNYAQ